MVWRLVILGPDPVARLVYAMAHNRAQAKAGQEMPPGRLILGPMNSCRFPLKIEY
jgi:hypothetical protein